MQNKKSNKLIPNAHNYNKNGLLLILLENIRATSINEMKSSKQYSRWISIVHDKMKQEIRQTEDLEYLNILSIFNFQKYFPISLHEEKRNCLLES